MVTRTYASTHRQYADRYRLGSAVVKSVKGLDGWYARPTKVREDGICYWQARRFVGGEVREVTKALGWMTSAEALECLRAGMPPDKEARRRVQTTLSPKWKDAAIREALGLVVPQRDRWTRDGQRSLYLMRSGRYVKVGVTTHVVDRVEDLQCGNPMKIVLVGTCDGNRLLEGTLHKVLRDYNVRGEWFHLCDEVIARLQSAINYWREHEAQPRETCDHIFYCPPRHGQPERPGPHICMLERGHRGKCRQGVATPS